MKRIIAPIALCFLVNACTTTTTAPVGTTVPAPTLTSVAVKATTVAQTIAAAIQTINTGLLAAAPTINELLVATGNSGDATAFSKLISTDTTVSALATPLVNALLANVQTAITASAGQGPAVQQAAVNAALSTPAVNAVVAPVIAATTPTTIP